MADWVCDPKIGAVACNYSPTAQAEKRVRWGNTASITEEMQASSWGVLDSFESGMVRDTVQQLLELCNFGWEGEPAMVEGARVHLQNCGPLVRRNLLACLLERRTFPLPVVEAVRCSTQSTVV